MLIALVAASLFTNAGAGKLEDKLKAKAEELGKKTLGVDVTIGNIEIFAWKGKVEVHDVVVANPPGYKSEYFLKTGKITVDVHTWNALKSRGSDIDIEHVEVICLDLQYERTLTSSNVREIKSNLENGQKKPDEAAKKPEEEKEKKETDVHVHKVNISGVSAHTRFFGLPPQVLILGDIVKEDFSSEMKGASGMTAVFSIFMDTIIKSIAGNAKKMLEGAHKVVAKVANIIPGQTLIKEKEAPKTCFEKRAEEEAARQAAKKKGWCRGFELLKIDLQENPVPFTALFVSLGGLMSAAVVVARRRHRGPGRRMTRFSAGAVEAETLCDEANE